MEWFHDFLTFIRHFLCNSLLIFWLVRKTSVFVWPSLIRCLYISIILLFFKANHSIHCLTLFHCFNNFYELLTRKLPTTHVLLLVVRSNVTPNILQNRFDGIPQNPISWIPLMWNTTDLTYFPGISKPNSLLLLKISIVEFMQMFE